MNKLENTFVAGFVGTYCYDIILYFARSCNVLGKRTLVVDHNPNRLITKVVAAVDRTGMFDGKVSFYDIDVTQENLRGSDETEYDIILIDFGCNGQHEDYDICKRIYFMGDMMYHNIMTIDDVKPLREGVSTAVIFRDTFHCSIKPDYLIEKMNKDVKREDISLLYCNKEDMQARCLLESNGTICFSRMSEEMCELVGGFTREMYAELTDKEFRQAIKKTAKRLRRTGREINRYENSLLEQCSRAIETDREYDCISHDDSAAAAI